MAASCDTRRERNVLSCHEEVAMSVTTMFSEHWELDELICRKPQFQKAFAGGGIGGRKRPIEQNWLMHSDDHGVARPGEKRSAKPSISQVMKMATTNSTLATQAIEAADHP